MTASLLAVDLGTTRIKFGVLDDDGASRLVHSVGDQTFSPSPAPPSRTRIASWRRVSTG